MLMKNHDGDTAELNEPLCRFGQGDYEIPYTPDVPVKVSDALTWTILGLALLDIAAFVLVLVYFL